MDHFSSTDRLTYRNDKGDLIGCQYSDIRNLYNCSDTKIKGVVSLVLSCMPAQLTKVIGLLERVRRLGVNELDQLTTPYVNQLLNDMKIIKLTITSSHERIIDLRSIDVTNLNVTLHNIHISCAEYMILLNLDNHYKSITMRCGRENRRAGMAIDFADVNVVDLNIDVDYIQPIITLPHKHADNVKSLFVDTQSNLVIANRYTNLTIIRITAPLTLLALPGMPNVTSIYVEIKSLNTFDMRNYPLIESISLNETYITNLCLHMNDIPVDFRMHQATLVNAKVDMNSNLADRLSKYVMLPNTSRSPCAIMTYNISNLPVYNINLRHSVMIELINIANQSLLKQSNTI